MNVWCVMRSGGDYGPEHVERLRGQVEAVGGTLHCLSDMDGTLEYGWPGWWSKMEMFRPDIPGDLFFMDLDSSVVGDLSDMASIGRPAIMRDVYRPKGLQSSVMFLPEETRRTIWRQWIVCPVGQMRAHRKGGDQAFLETVDVDWTIWQDELPGQVVSYKADVMARGLSNRARLVVFHGKPRPWDVGW